MTLEGEYRKINRELCEVVTERKLLNVRRKSLAFATSRNRNDDIEKILSELRGKIDELEARESELSLMSTVTIKRLQDGEI